MVPLMIPHIVVAVGVFFLFARISLNNTLTGIIPAHTMLAIPFVLITTLSGLQGFDMNQERAAQSLPQSHGAADQGQHHRRRAVCHHQLARRSGGESLDGGVCDLEGLSERFKPGRQGNQTGAQVVGLVIEPAQDSVVHQRL